MDRHNGCAEGSVRVEAEDSYSEVEIIAGLWFHVISHSLTGVLPPIDL